VGRDYKRSTTGMNSIKALPRVNWFAAVRIIRDVYRRDVNQSPDAAHFFNTLKTVTIRSPGSEKTNLSDADGKYIAERLPSRCSASLQ
jgi:hypothetical protein